MKLVGKCFPMVDPINCRCFDKKKIQRNESYNNKMPFLTVQGRVWNQKKSALSGFRNHCSLDVQWTYCSN